MKLKLLSFLFLLSIGICYSQMKPVVITFKDGALLTGIGKKKGSTFKYKSDNNAKAKEFEFSKIESVKMENYNDKDIIYKFFQVEGDERFIAVEELVSGTKAELFTTSSTFNHGGMGMGGSQSVTFYYVKRPNEEKLTELGEYSPLTNNLKSKVKSYFSDCKRLIDKLENRDFKVREGLEDIVAFYNDYCE